MTVCSTALINVARAGERWSISFLESSIYGTKATSNGFQHTAVLLVKNGADPLLERTKALIAEEGASARKRPRLQSKPVLLNPGGVKSLAVVIALVEIGIAIFTMSA
ncbi:hypothetical protein [Sinorhizobium meliloti]|uniref:hypothetical protein n=1 Tax=Rhizobium meliloti TaxID=382 RepID=UPI0020900970|nr:hypothetical protein [Sinorhizobium meliloti]MCO5966665.1 hypothetical protein [Sinorhizobium meliloti]